MNTTKIRPRMLAVLAAFVGLMGVVAVTVPSSSAEAPGFVRLNLGSDGRYFEYGTDRQTLTTAKNGCQITSTESLIDLSSTGTQSQPGLGPDGIGVKQSPSSGNGTPCTQVEPVETLTLKPAPGSPLTGKRFSGVRLDLEMTGNAVVQLTFSQGAQSETYQLQTGTSIEPDELAAADLTAPYVVDSDADGDKKYACAAPNSSGPNSGSSDNCQWRVDGSFDFDTITLTTALGTVSLEGGGDFGTGSDFDTLLYLNTAPMAVADSFTTNEDTAVSGNVLDNDSDADGGALTAALDEGPAHGTLSLATSGTFTYTPTRNYNGPDSFSYTVSDGRGATSNPATVSITVIPVNDAPTATGDSVTIAEGGTGTVDVADDEDSDAVLTVTCTEPITEPPGWNIEDLGDGVVRITPPAEFVGNETISCTVTDEKGETTEVPVTIAVGVTNVNDAPVALDDEADFDPEDGPSVAIDVLANDTDADAGDALSVENIDLIDGGSASVAGGTVTYTPPVGTTAPVTFTYQAFDGEAYSNVATVTVYPLICSSKTVSTPPGEVSGTFTRLTDPEDCKRYTLQTDFEGQDTILFQPSGVAQDIQYRGVVTFGADVSPPLGADPLRLSYDPLGDFDFKPMQWCLAPQFDETNILESDAGFPLFAAVTGATLPIGESWCIASAYTQSDANGDLITFWQVYGEDDPRMTR